MVVILNHPPLQSPRMENLYTYLGKYLFNFEFKRLSEWVVKLSAYWNMHVVPN